MSLLIDWLNTPALTTFGAPTSWAEVLGFLTGALCVWLVAEQHVLNWPLGIANNLLWILLFALPSARSLPRVTPLGLSVDVARAVLVGASELG